MFKELGESLVVGFVLGFLVVGAIVAFGFMAKAILNSIGVCN